MDHLLSGLAVNPALPPALLDRLIAAADAELAYELADRPALDHAQVRALARFDDAARRLAYAGLLRAEDIDPSVQPDAALALLDQGRGRPEWALLFVDAPQVERREQLAACPGLPPEVTARLAEDREIQVLTALALWTTSAEIAARLAEHPHAEVRRAAAVNEATPPTVLAALLTGEGLPPALTCAVCEREPIPFTHDPYCPRPDCQLPPGAACDGTHQSTVHAIHQGALANPASPPAVAACFAGHPSYLLRLALAARTDLPTEAYATLAEAPLPGVRAELAGNPAIGEQLIRALAEDDGPDVRHRLAHHPRLPLDLLGGLAALKGIGRTLLPRIALATPSEIEQLVASPDPAVRMLVAQRRDLPPRLRDILASDGDAKVLAAIAPHPGLPDPVLQAMAERHGPRVAAAVAANPDVGSELLEELTRQHPQAVKALREIARHPRATAPALLVCLTDHRARRTAAGHPALPPSAFPALLADEDWQVVEAAAANPSLPAAAMAELAAGRAQSAVVPQ